MMADVAENRDKPIQLFGFYFISIVIGLVAGLGALVFRGLIAFFHNLLFLGTWSLTYDANVHTPVSPWGPFVILVPVAGALVVAFLVKTFAPEAKGHGVPEVMDAVYYNRGIIRPIVAVVKSLASAISIGSGGSIGREGPIIQIGSSFGSTLGQLLSIPMWQRITLIAGGAGGGIAATFNTPIGGILFAAEIIMPELSVRTLVPVTISTVTATYIGRLFFGVRPSFSIPGFQLPYLDVSSPDPLVLLAYVALGILMGAISALYIRSIYGFEDFFDEKIPGNYYTRHMFGMLLVGVMMYVLMAVFGHYYIEGVGYATVQDVLSGKLTSLYLLLILFVLKLLSTSLTLGSGASGGIFSPSLYMGATFGGAYGIVLKWLFPSLAVSPPAFAVAGMAGMVGGCTGAALTAIVMIFEMTLDYSVIIPMTTTVALSYGVRRMLLEQSIYTLKLFRRGHFIPLMLQAKFEYLKRAKDIMDPNLVVVSGSATPCEVECNLSASLSAPWFLVQDHDQIAGVISRNAIPKSIIESRQSVTLNEISNKDYLAVTENTTLFKILAEMHWQKISVILVVASLEDLSPSTVKGVISKERITDLMAESIGLFAD